jgi:protein O-GlcNAc transferase
MRMEHTAARSRGQPAHDLGPRNCLAPCGKLHQAMSPQSADHLKQAREHHIAGRLPEAEALYQQILRQCPDHAEALHGLGMLEYQSGRPEISAQLIRRAVAADPHQASYHANLAVALAALQKYPEAIAEFRQALILKPDYPLAQHQLANVLRAGAQLDEAIEAYRAALQSDPDHPEARYNLGAALRLRARPAEAVVEFRKAIALRPDFAAAYNNLGIALLEIGQIDAAAQEFRRAISLDPEIAESHANLNHALQLLGQFAESVAVSRQLVQLRPQDARAHYQLGMAGMSIGDLATAVAALERAAQLQPNFPDALNALAGAYFRRGRVDQAIAAYQQILQLDPDNLQASQNLLLALHYQIPGDAQEIYRRHVQWNIRHARPLKNKILRHANDRDVNRRLRIGYVSADFHEHPVSYFLENLLANHNSQEVEIFCYQNGRACDAVTRRLQASAQHWRQIGSLSDSSVAQIIREDRIDILVDLSGHTSGNRLLVFAEKPAPIQGTYLGYPDTTGMETIDYRFTDAYADPPQTTDALHSEKLIRLPRTFACYRPPDDAPPPAPSPAISRGFVTFGSFNALSKIRPQLLDVWANILQEIPDSRLILATRGLGDPTLQRDILIPFENRHIAANRLRFLDRQSLAAYLLLHGEVDLLLDTFPVNGHTTSCHALWMGVPVITLAGQTHCQRLGASVLSNLGIPEMIAHTPREYLRLAKTCATDVGKLADLRAGLRDRMRNSPLLDARQLARDVEAGYRRMWQTWCSR